MNVDFRVTRDAICQWFSLVTSSIQFFLFGSHDAKEKWFNSPNGSSFVFRKGGYLSPVLQKLVTKGAK